MASISSSALPDNILRCIDKAQRKPLGKAGMTTSEAQYQFQKREERKIHDTVEKWLRLRGIPFIHGRMDKPSTFRAGWPDFTVISNGKAFCLELKAIGGVLSSDQKEVISELERTGTPVKVAYSDDEALNWLRGQIDSKP